MTTPNEVQQIVADAGGAITGKTRLQKSAYFLEADGVGSGFDFNYHYYGPYSEELATAATDASALGLVSLDWSHANGGFSYATYRTAADSGDNPRTRRRQQILAILDRYDAVSLELAATAHFLSVNGFAKDPWAETRRRKAAKVTDERILRAKELLDEIGFVALA